MYQNIQYFKYTLEDFLKPFDNYNFKMETFIREQFHEYQKKSKSFLEIKNLGRGELIKYSKESHECIQFYPQSFRSSFLIQLFSILEYELKEICLIHSLENKAIFSINDIKGNSEIEKAKLYLKKAADLNISSFQEWKYLDDIRIIRNLFVHHQGEIYQNNSQWKKIRFFIKNNQEQIGFSDSADYLDDVKFLELYENEYNSFLEIRNIEFNTQLICNIKSFLKKIVLSL